MIRRIFPSARRAGFTVLELMIVLIMVGAIGAIAMIGYVKTSESARDKEAQNALKLIQRAEQRYLVRFNAYYPASGTVTDLSTINTTLELNLESESRWDIAIEAVSAGADFRATAARIDPPYGGGGPYDRTWEITATTDNF